MQNYLTLTTLMDFTQALKHLLSLSDNIKHHFSYSSIFPPICIEALS